SSLWTQTHTVLGDNIEPQRMVEMADSTLWIIGEGLLDNVDEGTEIFALKLDKEGNLLFEERYSYGGYENGNDIVLTSSNELIIAGTADSFNGSGNDVLAIHLTAMGEEILHQSYGGIGNADFDQSFGLLEIADEGYLLSGHSDSFNERGDLDIYLLRLTKKGEVMWSKTLDFFNGRDVAYNVAQANDGGFGIYGISADETGLLLPQFTRTDDKGNVLWSRRFESLLPVFTKAVNVLADNGWIVSGRLLAGGVYIAKIDDTGEIVWENSYTGNVAYNIHPTSDGGYILAGRANFQQDPETNAFYTPLQVVKTDENGNMVWERLMGSSASLLSRAFDVTETISGSFVLIGGQTGETASTSNLLMAKLSESGSVLWEREMLTEEYSFNNYVVEQTTDNGFIFIGNVGESGDAQRRSFLLKTDGFGSEKWIRLFGEDVGTFPVFYDGLQTQDGGYAMTGAVSVNNSVEMYFVKADELGFTEIVGIFSPSVRLLLQLAPNPNDGRFQMTFEGEDIGAVDLTIFDATGRSVFAHSSMKKSVLYQEELDLSDLNSGVYVLEVISGDKRYSQRLVIR
ncbi:MAG: T9SS type A sorting domain-containing protein, partial [Chitinophagales bacterium]